MLSEEAVPILGHYSNGDRPGLPVRLSIEYNAFQNLSANTPQGRYVAHGNLQNMNTVESFKAADKQALLRTAGDKVWTAILTGTALSDPSLLCQFYTLSFADLKKYNFVYWFAFPALMSLSPVTVESVQQLKDVWSDERRSALCAAFDDHQKTHGPSSGYFLVKSTNDRVLLSSLQDFDKFCSKEEQITLGFCDPCTLDTNPGWPLRNFLALAGKAWGDKVDQVDVLCLRDTSQGGVRDVGHSLLLKNVSLPKFPDSKELPKVVGWEKNEHGKLAPRVVNLSRTMDPVKLAESAVDLNLKLMRWRLMPQLDLELIKNTKCLLLGAGTLGCNVARGLLGWGVKNITFVDNSRVSYSNPVRQTLFVFDDSHNGGKMKAETAAEALRRIFPGVNSRGVNLTIPMPGHAIGSEPAAMEETKKAVQQLEELIREHDVTFLLLDTRESRWLPTVMCLAYNKLCINAALGFDTYMVMRHAYRPAQAPPIPKPSKHCIPGNEIGCYFCSDVVAPTNSTRDRTLDQQCTVSRPGTSMTAAALAVEIMTSVLQHPMRGVAPAPLVSPDDIESSSDVFSCLGLVPHQIRGFLSHFTSVLPASRAFEQCTACSDTILTCYKEEGFEFLLKVFNNSDFLESITGLDKLFKSTDDVDILILDDDEDF